MKANQMDPLDSELHGLHRILRQCSITGNQAHPQWLPSLKERTDIGRCLYGSHRTRTSVAFHFEYSQIGLGGEGETRPTQLTTRENYLGRSAPLHRLHNMPSSYYHTTIEPRPSEPLALPVTDTNCDAGREHL